MPEDQQMQGPDLERHEMALGDAVSHNGADNSAARRTHMRELTTARQAAERRQARPAGETGLSRATQLAAARERAVELQAELARIDAEHRTWLHGQGENVPERQSRRPKNS
ncbi:MAG TPA: hypothetical protein VHB98_24155 [Chloroflexota bacterium]|jgi:hypothetical protein|nr:hypothetical protein [Chloroflexota bacterium]